MSVQCRLVEYKSQVTRGGGEEIANRRNIIDGTISLIIITTISGIIIISHV